ncbi:hypothetical protein A9R05_43565 (plasmid) [Burkholderia sp. KK1]|nr:hypothetical protein A9R05_43565 [Burkholderia sp. KK1]
MTGKAFHEVIMTTPSINRRNLGRQILAARAIANLNRVDLAKLATLAHATVKLAEEGEESVSEDALTKICRAVESLGFEFIDGTMSTSLAFHEPTESEFAGVTADASMPGWVRRIYPRRLDARGLVRDLDACGVQIENAERLVDLCATNPQPWPETLAQLACDGRKVGIRFYWRNGVENKDGVRHVIKIYHFSPEVVNALLRNILIPDAPTP